MNKQNFHGTGYILAAALGALGGGLIVMVTTRAIPKMMSSIMAGMMQTMLAQMKERGCAPAEI